MKIGDKVTFNNQEYTIMRFQKEGIRLRGTKNNPLGERFEIVVNEGDGEIIVISGIPPEGLF